MKKTLTLGMLLLGGCLAAAAQTNSTPNQTPQGSAPSTSPQEQTGHSPSTSASPADPSLLPPDQNAPGKMTHEKAADPATKAGGSQTTTIQGCLSESSDGKFMLADKSGNTFQLGGDTTQLGSYVGNEIRVDGTATPNRASSAAAMSSPAESSPGPVTQISVSKVRKIADVCAKASSSSK
jgi:hypothetical protein